MATGANVKWKKGEVTKVSPGGCMVYGTDAVLYTYYYRTAKSQGRFCKDDEVEFTNVAGEVTDMKLVKRTRPNALYHLLRNMTVAAQGKNLNNSVQKGRVTIIYPKGTILIWCEDRKLSYRYYPPDQTVALKPGDTVTFEVADGKAVAVKRP